MTKSPAQAFSTILGGSAFIFICRVTGAALTLLLQVLLARWMGATELGTYVLAFSWCILLSTLSQLGFVSATLRVIGHALARQMPGVIWGFLRRAVQIILLSSSTVALLGCLVVLLSGESLVGGATTTFVVALICVPVLALISFQCIIAVAFRWLGLAFLLTEVLRPVAIVGLVTAVWLASGRLSATGVILVQAAVMGTVAAALWFLVGRRLRAEVPAAPAEFDTPLWVKTALPLLLISLFGNYFPELMLILLGPQVSSDQIAIFNASYRVALIVTFGLTAIDSVTSPAVAKLYASRDGVELQRVVSRAARLGVAGSIAALAGFAILGRFLLGLFGEEFVAGYATLMILVAAQSVRAAAGPVMSVLSVTGHQHRCLVVFAAALAAAVLLTVVLAPAYGIRGAAASVFLVTLGWSIWLHRLVVVHVGIKASIFWSFSRA